MTISALELVDVENCRPGTMQPSDFVPIRSRTGLAKIMKSFDKTPFDFRFYLANYNCRDSLQHKLTLAQEVDAPNSIQVIFTNNVTTREGYMPFTAWILAHRLAHVNLPNPRKLSYKGVFTAVQDMLLAMPGLESFRNRFMVGPSDGDMDPGNYEFQNFIRPFITSRAGRRGEIGSAPDVFAELVAQYIITGKITLASISSIHESMAHHTAVHGVSSVPRIYTNGYRASSELNSRHMDQFTFICLQAMFQHNSLNDLQSTLLALEVRLNREVHAWLSKMVGKTWAF